MRSWSFRSRTFWIMPVVLLVVVLLGLWQIGLAVQLWRASSSMSLMPIRCRIIR